MATATPNTIHTDQRHELEALAYRTISFPSASVEDDLADLAPHLTPAQRDTAFGHLVDGIDLRGTAVRACNAVPACVPEILAKWVTPKAAARVAGMEYPALLMAAKVIEAIQARNWDALEGLDLSVDGALRELADLRTGYATAADYPDADTPDRLEELAEEKLTAALASFSAVAEERLAEALVDFTVACWRFTDSARLRLTGGADHG